MLRQRLVCSVLFMMFAFLLGHQAQAQRLVELNTWYSPSRGDHITSTDPAWARTAPAPRSPDYRWLRSEGWVFSPDEPQPPGTLALWSFWNPARNDNFMTTDPAWTGAAQQQGYTRYRLEGYIHERPLAGTIPLRSYWSPSNQDNAASTDPRLTGRLRLVVSDPSLTSFRAGDYQHYRVQGYVLPHADDLARSDAFGAQLTSIGHGQFQPGRAPRARSLTGARPPRTSQAPLTQAPIVVVPLAFTDMGFEASHLARYRQLFSPSNPAGFQAMMRIASRGRYVPPAVTVTPVIQETLSWVQMQPFFESRDCTGRPANCSHHPVSRLSEGEDGRRLFQQRWGFGLEVYDLDGDGIVQPHELDLRWRTVFLLGQTMDLSVYDTDRDGRIDSNELIVLRFGADPGIGGQQGWSAPVETRGKTVHTSVSLVARDTTLAGLVHEISHTWGTIDLYGPQFEMNFTATIMGAMSDDDLFFQFDPWHRIALGWHEPRFMPITGASGSAFLTAMTRNPDPDTARPILFYDPQRGLSEYFLVEFRTRTGPCSPDLGRWPVQGNIYTHCQTYGDSGGASTGMSIWHFRARPGETRPVVVFRSDDTRNLYNWPRNSGPDANLFAVQVVPPVPATQRGEGGSAPLGRPVRFWRQGDGEANLTWWDGSDAGIRIRTGPVDSVASTVAIEWRPTPSHFMARIDRVAAGRNPLADAGVFQAGGMLLLHGQFGAVAQNLQAGLIGPDGVAREAQVTRFTPEVLIITLPESAPPGRHELVVGERSRVMARRRNEVSNAAIITIQSGQQTASRVDPSVLARHVPSGRAVDFSGRAIDFSALPGGANLTLPQDLATTEDRLPQMQEATPINPHGVFGEHMHVHGTQSLRSARELRAIENTRRAREPADGRRSGRY